MRQLKITQSITNRGSSSVERYLSDISREERISPEEEVELTQEIRKGNKRALERMCRANLRFVVSVAKQYQHQGMPLEDLIDEGNIGLVKAAERFDETRGFKFISYAVWWIRQSIMQALAEQSSLIRTPLNRIGIENKVKRASSQFFQKHGHMPTNEELSEILQEDVETIVRSKSDTHSVVSVDAPMGDDMGNMLDVIPSTDYAIEESGDKESLDLDLQRVLSQLSTRERLIICRTYGIGCKELSLDEVALQLNLTRERVRQIREKTVKKLSTKETRNILAKYMGN